MPDTALKTEKCNMRCKKKQEHRHSDVDNYVSIHINAMPKVLDMLLKLSNIVIVHL